MVLITPFPIVSDPDPWGQGFLVTQKPVLPHPVISLKKMGEQDCFLLSFDLSLCSRGQHPLTTVRSCRVLCEAQAGGGRCGTRLLLCFSPASECLGAQALPAAAPGTPAAGTRAAPFVCPLPALPLTASSLCRVHRIKHEVGFTAESRVHLQLPPSSGVHRPSAVTSPSGLVVPLSNPGYGLTPPHPPFRFQTLEL